MHRNENIGNEIINSGAGLYLDVRKILAFWHELECLISPITVENKDAMESEIF